MDALVPGMSATTYLRVSHTGSSQHNAGADSQLSQLFVTCSQQTQRLPRLPILHPPTCCDDAQHTAADQMIEVAA
jgi:hypothetical protein